MKGDKLVIHDGHRRAVRHILPLLLPQIEKTLSTFIITIAGESGSGKSEIAAVLSESLLKEGIKSLILQQDDYFVYPPKTNARKRKEDIGHVGMSEVHLAQLDRDLKDIMEGKSEIVKPLVIFEEDQITQETVKLKGIKAVIVDGAYTTVLNNVHRHIFIDRTHIDTRAARKRRAREPQDDFLEKILEIEHKIISSHKSRADIIITKNYEIEKNDSTG